jgi:uncharacterized membrane protein YdjX (TVP38/TMEM64 family)
MHTLPELSVSRHRVAWIFGALLIALLALEGHHLAGLLPVLDRVIERLGPRGPLVYIAAIIVLEPFLIPNTIFGLAAGAVFGLWEGYLYYFGAVYLANMLVYLIGRRLLSKPVLRQLDKRPNIRDAAAAANTNGTGLVFWLRAIPMNPAILSYALGALHASRRSLLIGTLGMAPHMFVDVYLGTVAVHVTKMAGQEHTNWETKGVILLLGLIAVFVVSWRITRIARGQIERAR